MAISILPGSRGRAGLTTRLLESELGVNLEDIADQDELVAHLVNLTSLLKNQADLREGNLAHREDRAAVMLSEYKARVAKTTMQYAITYGWCDQVRAALRQLDIDLDEPELDAEVTVTYRFRGRIPYDHLMSFNGSEQNFILAHTHVPSLIVESDTGAISVPDPIDPAEVKLTKVALLDAKPKEAEQPTDYQKVSHYRSEDEPEQVAPDLDAVNDLLS